MPATFPYGSSEFKETGRRQNGYLSALQKYKAANPPIVVPCSTKDHENRIILENLLQYQPRSTAVSK